MVDSIIRTYICRIVIMQIRLMRRKEPGSKEFDKFRPPANLEPKDFSKDEIQPLIDAYVEGGVKPYILSQVNKAQE